MKTNGANSSLKLLPGVPFVVVVVHIFTPHQRWSNDIQNVSYVRHTYGPTFYKFIFIFHSVLAHMCTADYSVRR